MHPILSQSVETPERKCVEYKYAILPVVLPDYLRVANLLACYWLLLSPVMSKENSPVKRVKAKNVAWLTYWAFTTHLRKISSFSMDQQSAFIGLRLTLLLLWYFKTGFTFDNFVYFKILPPGWNSSSVTFSAQRVVSCWSNVVSGAALKLFCKYDDTNIGGQVPDSSIFAFHWYWLKKTLLSLFFNQKW